MVIQQAASGAQDVTIRAVRTWPLAQPSGHHRYVVIEVLTDAGISGWGEVAVGGDVAATVGEIAACQRHLIGQDALGREALWRLLSRELQRGGGRPAAMRAAIDMATVDILGKLTQSPAYEVLGGPTREKARAAAVLNGHSEAELMESLRRMHSAGFRAVMVPLMLPTGPTRGRRFYRETRQLLERMREATSGELDFVLDCGGRATPAEAAGLARGFEDFHLLWLDEPTGPIQQRAAGSVAAESATPIGWGRQASDVAAFQNMLREDAIDVVRPDIATFGMTAIRKAAALAETYYVAVAPFHRGGPVATAATLHVAASIPNFFIQEIPVPGGEADRSMRRDLCGDLEMVREGFLSLPQGPGLGLAIDREALDSYRVG